MRKNRALRNAERGLLLRCLYAARENATGTLTEVIRLNNSEEGLIEHRKEINGIEELIKVFE